MFLPKDMSYYIHAQEKDHNQIIERDRESINQINKPTPVERVVMIIRLVVFFKIEYITFKVMSFFFLITR